MCNTPQCWLFEKFFYCSEKVLYSVKEYKIFILWVSDITEKFVNVGKNDESLKLKEEWEVDIDIEEKDGYLKTFIFHSILFL